MEIYRYLIDDFLIRFCNDLSKKDFVTKNEIMARGKIGRREYLNDAETKALMAKLDMLFISKVNIPRIMHGKTQEFESLLNEECLLLAKYFRHEIENWFPRLVNLNS